MSGIDIAALGAKYAGLLSQLAEFALVTVLLYLPARFVLRPLVSHGLARWNLNRTLEQTIEKALGVVTVLVAVVAGAWAAGFAGLLGGSALFFAALTLAIGFAAQDVLSNFVAGIFIVQDPNFNIDDWIEWEDKAGFIDDIGFRVTRIRTFDNETVTVPNTVLATTPVTNRMSNETLRISYTVGIGYADDIDTATRILLDAAADHADILDDPEPSVRVAELADSAILLQSRFWIADPDREDFSVTRSEYIQETSERFREAGIDLSTTTQHQLSGNLSVDTDPRE
ncbi:mechanosensitive ion channel [Halovenus sp. WSH3]|uniref:Mechanosensitive ion channel n=1 Tax=Halovenus carboxidivorans TaxID=2692199 RepID=A0A6B0T9K7_9EURY|nr:mechanosensitive ion channel family protein [Halovenus carboxidivorans]MXR52042.1 mechanosensitive ion channel [Halovenus carboxidivorans]